jgi:hypothetical protein
VEKPRAYAETGIPVHLLIDRGTHEVKVHSPSARRCRCPTRSASTSTRSP